MQSQIVARRTVGVCEFVNQQNKNSALVINDYLCLIVIFYAFVREIFDEQS